MKNELELEFRLTVGDLDDKDNITFYSIANLFQEAATIHAEELNVGYDKMIEKNLAWIVARNKITIINNIKPSKIVKVKTWPHPNGRFDFDRDYLLLDENNNLIAKGTSKWLVYDLKRNFLCSSKGIMEDVNFKEEKNYSTKFDKINYGDFNDYNYISDYKIQKSDIDHYGHMNNAKYFILMNNALNIDVKNITEVQIDYLNQGYLNDNIKLYQKISNNEYYLIGKKDENIVFAIKVILVPIDN